MDNIVYLAGPYTHHYPHVLEVRRLQHLEVLAKFTKAGECVYSSIVHFHDAAKLHNLPKDFDFWKEINLTMLSVCDKLYLMKGWRKSKGCLAEATFAFEHSIEVYELDEDFEPVRLLKEDADI